MDLNEVFHELNNGGYSKVWLMATHDREDDDGNPMWLDLLLSHIGEQITRCCYWPDQTDRNWKMTTWGLKDFDSPLSVATEVDVKTVLTGLSLGFNPASVLPGVTRQIITG